MGTPKLRLIPRRGYYRLFHARVTEYKRLEEGVFKMLRIEGDAKSVELRASELAMMLDGIDLRSVQRVKRYARKNVSA